jgi:predicted tellurium resistance membrane protein TerC
MDAFLTSEGLLALVTLTFLEIILGVDNVIFISILSGKLPASDQARARRTGLAGAMLMRIALLLSIAWVVRLTAPLFSVFGHEISGRDIILLGGGLFLIGKATLEIHERLEGEEAHGSARVAPSFKAVILQIMLLDIVFSLDSVITAIGMAQEVAIMVAAVVLSVAIMMFSAEPISQERTNERHVIGDRRLSQRALVAQVGFERLGLVLDRRSSPLSHIRWTDNTLTPEKLDNPLVSMFLGGISELAAGSPYLGVTLDVEQDRFVLKSGISGDSRKLDEAHRVFFSDPAGPGTPEIPQLPALIGGFTFHLDLANWYRQREKLLEARKRD